MNTWSKPISGNSRISLANAVYAVLGELKTCVELLVVNNQEVRRLIFSYDRIVDVNAKDSIADYVCEALFNFRMPCQASYRTSNIYSNHNISNNIPKTIPDEKWILNCGVNENVWGYIRDESVLCGLGWSEWKNYEKVGEAIAMLDELGQRCDYGKGLEFLIWSPTRLGRGGLALKPPAKTLTGVLANGLMGFATDPVAVRTRVVVWFQKTKIAVKLQVPGNVLNQHQFFIEILSETIPFGVQDQGEGREAAAPAAAPAAAAPKGKPEKLACEQCKGFHRIGDCSMRTPTKGILKRPSNMLENAPKKVKVSPGTIQKGKAVKECYPKRGRKISSSSSSTTPSPARRKKMVKWLGKSKDGPSTSKSSRPSTSQVDHPSTSGPSPRKKRGRPAKARAKMELAKFDFGNDEEDDEVEILSDEEDDGEEEDDSFIVVDEDDEESWGSKEQEDDE